MGYPWLTTVHVAHDVVSMSDSIEREVVGSSFNFTGVCLFCLPFLLFGSVARCQSTGHGARRRLNTFNQHMNRPNDFHPHFPMIFLNTGGNTVSDALNTPSSSTCTEDPERPTPIKNAAVHRRKVHYSTDPTPGHYQ